ncbi:MAG: glycosyltransferase family 4 protein [Bacteroidota bacterium]
MKVLFIQKEGGIFGAENYHLNILPVLVKRGITVHFLRLYTNYQGGEGGDFVKKLNNIGIKTFEVNIGRFPGLRDLLFVRRVVNEGGYDFVHSHLIHADLYISIIKIMFGLSCPWITTKHGYDNSYTSKHGFDPSKQSITLYYLMVKLSEKLSNKSYTISHGLRNFFIKANITQPEKMGMIHYGFDFEETSDRLIDSDFRFFKQQIVIAGRLVAFKGHKFLLESLTKLMGPFDNVGLVIVGSGEQEAYLRQVVEDKNLQSRVRFVGYSKEVSKWMYNSDVVAVPSISEGFGVVFLEAFNCKKPVVSWDVPSGNEIMENGKSGYLVSPYDTDALSKQLGEIFENPEAAKQVGKNAYDRLKSYFTLNRMVKETVAVYKTLVN